MNIVGRSNYKDDIPDAFRRALGADSWKRLPGNLKMTYLMLMKQICKDDDMADYHIGDEHFQNHIIGGTAQYLNFLSTIMSKDFCTSDVISYRDTLQAEIEVSKSVHKYTALIKQVHKYTPDLKDKDTNGRRFTENGAPKIMPINAEALSHYFGLLDQIWAGICKLQSMPLDEQEPIILSNLWPANSGYPFFRKQRTGKTKKMFAEMCVMLGVSFKNDDFITVDKVFECVHKYMATKQHWPYLLFYRTSGGSAPKERAVFGAHYLMKLVAAVISAGKFTAFNERPDGFYDEHITKFVYSVGGLPIVAQQPWEEMFASIMKRLPRKGADGKLQKMSAEQIKHLFNYSIPNGDYEVDVFGEDFPSFDTSMIYEDFIELKTHKHMGWLVAFILEDLKGSDVWSATLRFIMIFFKSGHPLTSDFGSYFHRKILYNVRDWLRNKGVDAHILAASLLSDDSIVYVINITPKDVNDYLKEYGLYIKLDESYQYSRDFIIGFLKVYVGYILGDGTVNYVGDPVSRYYGMAHSEREIEQDLKDPDESEGDTRGVWAVTGDIELDAFISKLASFGDQGSAIVYAILNLVKDTALGKSAILAISALKPRDDIQPYRSDVPVGFHPSWLANVPVLELLQKRDLQ